MLVNCGDRGKYVNLTEKNIVSLEVEKNKKSDYEITALFIGYCYGHEKIVLGSYAAEEEAIEVLNWLIDMMDDGMKFATMPDKGQIRKWNRDDYHVDC